MQKNDELELYDKIFTGPAPYAAIDPLAEDAGVYLDFNPSLYKPVAFQAYEAGDYRLAAQVLLYVLKNDINDAQLLYLLACCYGWLDDSRQAALCLTRAGRAGFEDLKRLADEPAFERLRGDVLFDRAVASLIERVQLAHLAPGELRYIQAAALLPYRVLPPAGYDPRQACPLVIGLHGYGSNGEWFARIWAGFSDPRFIYAAPQAPYAAPPAQYDEGGLQPGYSWYDVAQAYSSPSAVPGEIAAAVQEKELSEQYVLSLIDELKQQYEISEVYLLGFSQGGIMAYDIGVRHPGLLSGVMCFGAPLAGDLDAAQLAAGSGLRVFIAHGTSDRSVEIARAYAARDTLQAAGYDVTFMEYAGGHGLGVEALQAAQAWMLGAAPAAP